MCLSVRSYLWVSQVCCPFPSCSTCSPVEFPICLVDFALACHRLLLNQFAVHAGVRMNSSTLYGQIQSFSCDSFYMADLDDTMLHYLAVQKAIVGVHRPVHSKVTLTYSLTWHTDHCSPWRMAFKSLSNAKALLKLSLHLLFEKTAKSGCQDGLLLKHSYVHTFYGIWLPFVGLHRHQSTN